MQIRSRFFHKPVFHHHGSFGEKKASWLELFYDLVYVAAFIQLGNAFAADISGANFLQTFIVFVGFWISWSGFTYYSNRYSIDDFIHRGTVFVHMFCVAAMAVLLPDVFKGQWQSFFLVYSFSQLILAMMYLRSYVQEELGRAYTVYWGTVFGISGIIWALSSFLPGTWVIAGAAMGSLAVLIAPLTNKARDLVESFPFDHEHLSERYALLTIIVLGESFVKVSSELSSLSSGASLILQSSFALLLTCSIWWIYFDDVAHTELKKLKFAMPTWLLGHLPLQLSIILLGVGIKKAVVYDLQTILPLKYALLLAGSLGVSFLATAIIDTVTLRKNTELSDAVRVNVRWIAGMALLLLGASSQGFTNFWFLSGCLVIALFQVFFDVLYSPHEINEEEIEASAKALGHSTAASKVNIKDPLTPIRKGVPADLKKDLYFYFVEASWPIVLVSFFFFYFLSNLLFAGLYMLSPGSVNGSIDQSFLDAFFFSVQTMSTIGYGALNPGNVFGNVLVTVQAVYGLFSIAIFTGFVFSKISRPQAKILFSNNVVRNLHNKRDTLSFRMGNARGNDIMEAKVSVSALVDEVTEEGQVLRRFYDLKLSRSRSPFFRLSWTVYHEVDEDSPFHVSWKRRGEPVGLMVTLMGHDGTYSDTIYAQKNYAPSDILEDVYFEDILKELPDGRLLVDYDSFHKLR